MESTASSGEAAPPLVSTGSERRIAGPVLGFLFGGLGYVAIGRWQRAAAWYAIEVALGASFIVGAFFPAPKLLWLAFSLFELTRIVIAIDVGRLKRTHPLPRVRLVAVIGISVVLFWGILQLRVRANLVEAFKIPSASMYPTLEVGDQLFVKKTARSFQRGDVVVFKYPVDPTVEYVKRIVGVGGDTVAIRDGQLVINEHLVERRRLDEPCRQESLQESCVLWEETLDGRTWRVALSDGLTRDFPRVIVPAGHYFVIGDNRDASSDSRFWGTVAAELMKGTASFVWWSWGQTGARMERINQPVR
jgi:signal peptidase I